MVSNCNKQINANRTVVHFEVTKMHSKPSCLRIIWVVWKGWASLCIFAEIGFSRFGYEWGFFAWFHACCALMLGAAMHTWLQIKRLNEIVTHPMCQMLANAWAVNGSTKMINDLSHLSECATFVQQRRKIAQNRFTVCIYVTWYVTVLHIEHIGLPFLINGIQWFYWYMLTMVHIACPLFMLDWWPGLAKLHFGMWKCENVEVYASKTSIPFNRRLMYAISMTLSP